MTSTKEPSKEGKSDKHMTPEEANDHFDMHFPHVVDGQLNREERERRYEELGVPEQLHIARKRVRRAMSGSEKEEQKPKE